MRKKILAFMLSGCMLLQGLGMTAQAAELPASMQNQTALEEVSETAFDEIGPESESGRDNAGMTAGEREAENPADTEEGMETEGAEAEESEAGKPVETEAETESPDIPETETESKSGTENESEAVNENETDNESEAINENETDNESEAVNENETDNESEAGNESEAESGTEADTEIETLTETEELGTETAETEAAETDLSADRTVTDETEALAGDGAFEVFGDEAAQMTAQSETSSVADGRTAGYKSNGNTVYFQYQEKDAENKTGAITGYLSEDSEITLPHKLGGVYMDEIGDSVFAGMDQSDPSDLSQLPKQSASGKKLLSSGENQILTLVNNARIKQGKIPLVMSATLREAARRKTLDMFNKGYFSHMNTDGTYTYHWLNACGYPYRRWAENIAMNYQSAEKLFDQWWNSPGHYENMMNPDLRAIGIGVYQGSDGKILGTQIFTSTIFQNLTDVKIEYGYEKIGSRAFYGCSSLVSVTIPSTVSEIAADAFSGCSSLTIFGKAGSYAEIYAQEHQIAFEAVEEICPIQKFVFEQEELLLEKGDMDTLQLIMEPADYKHLIKMEETADPLIVQFYEDGAVRAVGDGSTQIRAKAADLTAECRITVGIREISLEKISFYEEEITMYEGECMQPSYRITPVNATETIKMVSSDSNVIDVNDEEGTITAVSAGEAVLTVMGDTVSGSVRIIVLTEKKDLVLPEDLKAVTNVGSTLGDVSLEDYPGFSWKEPQTKLKAKKDESIQYFAAQYSDGDKIRQDCILPVAVSTASGMEVMLEGKALASSSKISLAEAYVLQIGIKATGAGVDASFYDVSCSLDHPEIAAVEEQDDSLMLTPKKAGKCSVTLEVKLKDRNGNYGTGKKAYGTYKKKFTFQIEDMSYVREIRLEPVPEMAEGVQILEDGSILAAEGVKTFRIRALAFDGNGDPKDTALTFAADKSGVLQVRAVKGQNGLADVTVKKKGSAAITVTAKDNGKRSLCVSVQIQDLSPKLAGSTWTLNKNKPGLTAAVNLQAAAENPILNVSLYEDKALTKESALFTLQNTGDGFEAGFLAAEQVKKSSYKLYLKVTAQTGDYSYPVTVKLKNTKPAVTLKQASKINLFYKDANALLNISTGTEKLVNVEQINAAAEGPHFEVRISQENDVWSGEICPVGVTAQNYKKVNKTVELKFTFRDYGEEFAVTKKLTVQNSYQKPALASAPADGMIYLKTGMDQAMFRIMEKTGKTTLVPGGDDNISVRLDDSMQGKAQLTVKEGNPDIVVQLSGEKSLTLKYIVANDNWMEALQGSFKLNVNKNTPSLTLEQTKLTFNTNAAGKEVCTVKASVSKNGTMQVVRLKDADIVGNSKAAKELLESGKLSICTQRSGDQRSLQICLNDSNVKNGTYQYKVYGWCMLGETKILRMNPVTLSITVTNKQPTVALKTKGKISFSDRESSGISYTPNISGVTGKIRTAVLRGSYASAFRLIQCADGSFQVKLREDAQISRGSYRFTLVFYLENGVKVESKTFTVKF